MKQTTLLLITGSGGVYHESNQVTYTRGNNWDNPDRNNRQGGWIGETHNSSGGVVAYGLGRGICRGLTAAYLIAGHSWGGFTDYLNSEPGRVTVRGICNMQSELLKYGKDKENVKVFHTFLKIKGMRLINCKHLTPSAYYRGFGDRILKKMLPGFGYHITIFGGGNGHSLAMRIEAGRIKFFDPNMGEVSYSYLQGSSPQMGNFLEHLFKEYYYFVNDIYIDRYTLR